MKNRFKVVEYSSGYAVRDLTTNKEHWMSDGVDCLSTPTGRMMKPGSEYFRRTWERFLNSNVEETEEAYFDEWPKHRDPINNY